MGTSISGIAPPPSVPFLQVMKNINSGIVKTANVTFNNPDYMFLGFDTLKSTIQFDTSSSSLQTLYFTLDSAITSNRISMRYTVTAGGGARTIKVSVSQDALSWTDLDTQTTEGTFNFTYTTPQSWKYMRWSLQNATTGSVTDTIDIWALIVA
jgi:hypothetical protein